MAKKTKRRRTRPSRDITAQEIFDLWLDSAKGGLGFGKKFGQPVFDDFKQPLLDKIQELLDAGEVFDKEAEKATKEVAKDTGKVCRMFTLGKTVSRDTFELVFTFVRENHPMCPAGGGAGGWCEI